MVAILARGKGSQEELSFDTLEMADNFGFSIPERTDYSFPQISPHLAEMQEQDKKLMSDIT
jgi:hypothetical protein